MGDSGFGNEGIFVEYALAMEMASAKWDYMVYDFSPNDDEEWDVFVSRIQSALKKWGSEGWELISAPSTHGGDKEDLSCTGFVVFMKKPVG